MAPKVLYLDVPQGPGWTNEPATAQDIADTGYTPPPPSSMAWTSVTGKPSFGTASLAASSDFATAAQGAKADTALQNAAVFATAAQGTKADSAVQPAGLSACWPVGSIFTSVVATNPATLLGFGTWAAFAAGRVLVGLDAGQTEFDTVLETGGAKTVTLDVTQIPSHTHVQDAHTHVQNSHNHTQDAHTHTQNSHTHTVTSVGSAATGSTTNLTGASDTSSTTATAAAATATNQTTVATNQAATATNQNATATNQNTGGGGAHSNLQPYIVVYFFQRTA